MNDTELKGIMGLCVRAGQAVFGEEGCMRALNSGTCGVLLLDGEISPKSRKRYEEACGRTGTPVRLLPGGLILAATGRPGMARAVQKGSFSVRLTG